MVEVSEVQRAGFRSMAILLVGMLCRLSSFTEIARELWTFISMFLASHFSRKYEMHVAAATEEVANSVGIKVHRLSELNADQVQELRARPRIDFSSIFETVVTLSSLYRNCLVEL
jgi:hypothetical protein